MKHLRVLLPLLLLGTPFFVLAANIEESVVKIFSTHRYPDPYKPWMKQAPSESTGTGIIIEGNRILTNAHVVLYAGKIQVQAHQSGTKFIATTEHIAPGIDLAILKLEDESLFENRPPLPRATRLPAIKDTVLAYGFPTGGNNLSITKGIVSRIEFTTYNNRVSGLRIQIDAAINPGNSGGPAISDDKMIGLAFSRRNDAENIGYIIPTEEIELFLADIADGQYDGKPSLNPILQTHENHALAPFLKLPKNTEGMIVSRPDPALPGDPLRPWDIITHIAGTPIDNEGMVKLDDKLRVSFTYLVQQRAATDDTIPLTLVRDGQPLEIKAPLLRKSPRLIPNLQGDYPDYFIYGPIVFSAATEQFVYPALQKHARYLAHNNTPLITRYDAPPAFPGEQLVIVSSPFFPHKTSTGYSNATGNVVKKINGTTIKNLPHLVETLRDAKTPCITIEFHDTYTELLVFKRGEMLEATEDILNDNGIRAQATPHLLKIWNTRP